MTPLLLRRTPLAWRRLARLVGRCARRIGALPDLGACLMDQCIGALVVVIAGVALHPVPAHGMPVAGGLKPLPQILVLHGILGRRAPAVALPVVDVPGDAVAHVLAVG